MIQRINITTDEDPFNEDYIEIEVDDKTKILSNESYAKEAYEMYMGSLSSYSEIKTDISKGTITEVKEDKAIVQLNEKYSTIIDLTKEKKEYLKYIQPDVILDLKVDKKRGEDTYSASFSGAVHDMKYAEIYNSIGKKVAYYSKVEELVHGGYYLNIDGVKVFMPGSLGGMNKLIDFNELLNKEIYVVPINYSKQFNMIVVSHREYLRSLKPMELDNIKYNVEYTGKVTGASKFGVFVEFNSESDMDKPFILTGLVPISEMDDATKKEFNERKFEPGTLLTFYVKNIVNENKIILSKFYIDWNETFENYKQDTVVNCTVTKIQGNVVFTTINNTQLIGTITNYAREVNVGDVIKLKISKIDTETKRIFLKPIYTKKDQEKTEE